MNAYWLEQTRADVPASDDWFSTAEIARLHAMRFPKRREDWRLGRWAGKCAVAACLGLPNHCADLARIEMRPSSFGAPEVFLADKPAELTISLSHRDGTALCAVARSGVALGCDLELVEPRSAGFISDYFTDEEQALIYRAGADCFQLTTLLWSAKESALKALCTGLRMDTRAVVVTEVGSPTKDAWSGLRIDHSAGGFRGWWRCSGGLVRTLVAVPDPGTPIELSLRSRLSVLAVTETFADFAYLEVS